MKVLEIGAGPKPQAKSAWPDAEIETMDVDPQYNPTYLNDARTMPEELYERFDAVFASHVLEHFTYWSIVDVLTEWTKVLKPGGEMHIVVPSLEWVAVQVESGEPSAGVLPHLLGGHTNQHDVHLCAFTMNSLRSYMARAGLKVVVARTVPYTLMAAGKPVEAWQNYARGVK